MLRYALASALVVTLAFAGCGGDDETSPSPNSTTVSEPTVSGGATAVKGRRARVDMTEFSFAPAALAAKPGRLTVTAVNSGKAPHEFVLIRTDTAPDALAVKGAEASEDGAIGEIEELQPGKQDSHRFNVKAGAYVFICNVPGHYKAGMRGSLTVK